MKLKSIVILCISFIIALGASAQQPGPQGQRGGGGDREAKAAEAKAKKAEEAAVYFADADSALYGVRYLMKYLYNKEHNLTFKEDRVVLVSPRVTVDMSYEGIGERRWREANPDSKGGDPTLAYRLTPSYYFYYPDSMRQVYTYRIIADDFLLSDGTCDNEWTVTSDEKQIGDYACRKATLDKGGRQWTAWFTTDLPCEAAPRDFNGLPGVIIELDDSTGEVAWTFNGIVNSIPEDKLFIKFPDSYREIDPARFEKLVKIFALSDHNYVQRAGLWDLKTGNYPEKYRPSTGLDACLIDNSIEK